MIACVSVDKRGGKCGHSIHGSSTRGFVCQERVGRGRESGGEQTLRTQHPQEPGFPWQRSTGTRPAWLLEGCLKLGEELHIPHGGAVSRRGDVGWGSALRRRSGSSGDLPSAPSVSSTAPCSHLHTRFQSPGLTSALTGAILHQGNLLRDVLVWLHLLTTAGFPLCSEPRLLGCPAMSHPCPHPLALAAGQDAHL